MLKVSTYAASQHGGRLAIGKAWARFTRDFAWSRQDAHTTTPTAMTPRDAATEAAAAEAKYEAIRAAELDAVTNAVASLQGEVAS